MEELIIQYGGAFAVAAYLVAGWWRSRNDAKNAQTQQLSTLSSALNAALSSIEIQRSRMDKTELALSTEREQRASEHIAAQNTIDELRDTVRKLRAEMEQSNFQHSQQVANLSARVKALESENKKLRDERDAARNECDEWRQTSERQQQEIDELKAKVSKLEKKDTGPLPELKIVEPQGGEIKESKPDGKRES